MSGTGGGGPIIIIHCLETQIEIGPDDPLYADLKAKIDGAAPAPEVPPGDTSTE
jgi:hypothetical protein